MSDFRFKTTVEPKILHQVFAVCGSEWGQPDPEAFAEFQTKLLVDAILKGRAAKAFYLESKEGEIACVCVVTQHKGFYKDSGTGGIGVPDPAAFGVNPATGLRLSYVFTLAKFRGLGLMGKLVKKAIDVTEEEILKKELDKLSDKKGSFRDMVTDLTGRVDPQLAKYYLGKKYFWYLYSAIKSAYSQFGFKPYVADGYIIPRSVLDSEAASLVQKLLDQGSGVSEHVPGKKLTLLDGSKPLDENLIALILQLRELDLLTDLNKTLFHSELSGGRRSLSSLTNVQTALSLTKLLGSQNELSSVAEQMSAAQIDPNAPKDPGLRKKSSMQNLTLPKFFLQPDVSNVRKHHAADEPRTKKKSGDLDYARIKGAVLTNELQQKSYYILWSLIMDGKTFIISLGELKVDPFGMPVEAKEDRLGRRRSSFTALNDLGGFNLQDLELLISAAVLVAYKRDPNLDRIYVTSQDLPDTVPSSVLYDFFINYLPRSVPNVLKKDDEGAKETNTVEYVEDFSGEQHLLPMAKRYGYDSPEFELDWMASGSIITCG